MNYLTKYGYLYNGLPLSYGYTLASFYPNITYVLADIYYPEQIKNNLKEEVLHLENLLEEKKQKLAELTRNAEISDKKDDQENDDGEEIKEEKSAQRPINDNNGIDEEFLQGINADKYYVKKIITKTKVKTVRTINLQELPENDNENENEDENENDNENENNNENDNENKNGNENETKANNTSDEEGIIEKQENSIPFSETQTLINTLCDANENAENNTPNEEKNQLNYVGLEIFDAQNELLNHQNQGSKKITLGEKAKQIAKNFQYEKIQNLILEKAQNGGTMTTISNNLLITDELKERLRKENIFVEEKGTFTTLRW